MKRTKKHNNKVKVQGGVKEQQFDSLYDLNTWVQEQPYDVHIVSIQKMSDPFNKQFMYVLFWVKLNRDA